ncbi:MAG TPA: Trm112 family protein, partial [Candidatus Latescibacteria bacterium]|nr:Trm112 family protein [Candidatus Latescibacterota bacterium]
MKQRLLALVVCPLCGDDLRCDPDDVDRADAEEIMEAELSCARGHRYPVINGVPRLLAPELLADTLRQF